MKSGKITLELSATLTTEGLHLMREFQASLATQTIHQSPAWPDLNPPTAAQTYLYFTAMREGRTISAGVIRLRKAVAGVQVAALQRGPVTAEIADLVPVLQAIEAALKQKGVATLLVNPHWVGADEAAATAALQTAGFVPVSREMQNFPTTTAMINTELCADDLMAQMSQTGRRHLRKAIKAGVMCRPMNSVEEAHLANMIMDKMAQETGLMLDSQHDFLGHFAYLKAHPNEGEIIVTEVGGKIFGAAVNYLEGSRGFNMLLTTSSDVSVPRAYVLMWDSILSMKALGAKSFDMVGFPDARYESDGGMASRGAFKRGFGPEIVRVTPIMSKSLRPVWHTLISYARLIRRRKKTAQIEVAT